MSPNIRLSLKLIAVAILSGVWVSLAFFFQSYWLWPIFLFACVIAWFPILISILICRRDIVLSQILIPRRILGYFGLAVFSLVSGFLFFGLLLIFLQWSVAYIQL